MKSFTNRLNNKQPYIIAEIGMNHNGSYKKAIEIISAAKDAGVNAVKFQLHIAQEETLPSAPPPPYFKSEDRFSYFKRTSFSLQQWKDLKNYSHSLGLHFIVSPFSIKAANILKIIGLDAYKVPSGEINNLPLLEYLKKTKIPIIISSGMSNWRDLDDAVKILKNSLVVVMQCSSQYPCRAESVGLNVIKEMKARYKNKIIGFSDHTLKNHSSIAGLVLGAIVFEKHFTISKKVYGPDARFSLEPNEMKDYVAGIDFINHALSSPVDKDNLEKYKSLKKIFEKSIVAARDLSANHLLNENDLGYKKPGTGIKANQYQEVIGKRLKKSIKKDQMIRFNNLT